MPFGNEALASHFAHCLTEWQQSMLTDHQARVVVRQCAHFVSNHPEGVLFCTASVGELASESTVRLLQSLLTCYAENLDSNMA